MKKSPTMSPFPALSRRKFVAGATSAGLIASVGFGAFSPVFAQQAVSEEKLMAEGVLPDIYVGSKDAKVTIVEYASMSCPHCAAFHKNIYPKLKEKYLNDGKVRLIMREFPLNQIAVAVSMLARCAGSNDKSAAMIDVFFEHQDAWLVGGNAEPKLLELSKQAGFTKESFEKCLGDEALFNKLIEQREVASKEFGVSRTPSFFINGKPLEGNIMNIDTFAAVIDPLLKNNS